MTDPDKPQPPRFVPTLTEVVAPGKVEPHPEGLRSPLRPEGVPSTSLAAEGVWPTQPTRVSGASTGADGTPQQQTFARSDAELANALTRLLLRDEFQDKLAQAVAHVVAQQVHAQLSGQVARLTAKLPAAIQSAVQAAISEALRGSGRG